MAPRTRNGNGFTLDEPSGTPGATGDSPVPIGGTDTSGVSSDTGPIDPASLAGAGSGDSGAGEPSGKRGRGRPKGSGKAQTGKTSSLDVGAVEVLLFNIHALAAAATGFDKIAINETEAGQLAKAVNNVQQFYPMHVSAKAMAWTNLIMVAGTVYGSRAVAIWADQKNKERAPANTGNVTSFGRPQGTA